MNDRPLLTILPDGAGVEPQQSIVTLQLGERRVSAQAAAPRQLTPEEEESIRWYLEEYRKFPFEPATTIAKRTAVRVRELGEQLFERLFTFTAEARELWSMVEGQLNETRLEIAGDGSRSMAPWEILWNPLEVRPVACQAAAFVRAGFGAAGQTPRNAPGAIRILLVISRPAGFLDAPFRSVAARLLDRVEGDARFRFEVLRPPTFEAFQSALRSAAEQGSPYGLVHFDGHGVHQDRAARRENRPERRRRGYLLFETPSDPDRPDYIDAPTLGEALVAGGAPILILNACRSARAEIWTEQMGSRRPLGSLAEELMRLGQPAVLAMQYNVEVETASRFAADLYEGLADHGSLARAVQEGRRNLFADAGLASRDRHLKMHDWAVPVLFERAPCSLGLDRPRTTREHSQRKGGASTIGTDDTLMAVERAFQASPVVVLTGPVGSGKSTLAAEYFEWDSRTRDEASRSHSPLHLRDPGADDTRRLVTGGARVLIETRDANFSPALDHSVVAMAELEMAERIALLLRQLPAGAAFDEELWRPVLTFSQGNPGVLLNLGAMAAHKPAIDPASILKIARSEPVGLDPDAFAAVLRTFEPRDLDCLALTSLFEGAVSSRTLRTLASAGSESAPELDDADAMFDRLSALGLAMPLGSSYYKMHPGLPGLMRREFERRYAGERGERIRGAMMVWFAAMCAVFLSHADSGERNAYELQTRTLGLVEPTIRRALEEALAAEDWPDARNLAAALRRVLTQQGRRPEWRSLAAHLTTFVPDGANGDPPPERESLWYLMQQDQIEDLMRIHSLAEAEWMQQRSLEQARLQFATIESDVADRFAREVLVRELRRMSDIRKEQGERDAAGHCLEALQIAQRLRSEIDEERIAAQLAGLYLSQEPVDWEELSYWLTYASELCQPHDRIGQAQLKILRGAIALRRSQPAEAVEHLQLSLTGLLPNDPSDERAECELKLAEALFEHRADLSESMQHFQSAIGWYDRDENVFHASWGRLAASRVLSKSGEQARAFFYAGEAARGFASLAPHAEKEAMEADRFAASLESVESPGDKRA
jgi:tetratricopeptide (TPR) repeat protein